MFLYQDELTTYRRPSVARAWHEAGGPGHRARLGEKANTERRVIGTLDVVTGRLFYWQRAHADLGTLIRSYQALSQAYPGAEKIYVAQNNWPVHFHQRILEAVGPLRIENGVKAKIDSHAKQLGRGARGCKSALPAVSDFAGLQSLHAHGAADGRLLCPDQMPSRQVL